MFASRAAKRNLDEKSFYGGVLHVCYVPEYETVEDTRLKLQDRRSYVARVARNRARKSRDKERICERPTPSETVTPDRTRTGQPQSSYREGTGGTSGVPHHSGFPLLPPPPREHGLYGPQYQPTEDKMGTLHNATPHTHQQQLESLSSDQTASRGQSTDSRLASSQTSVVRFVPRTAHLQNRKRKVDEVPQDSSTISEETGPLIGPKLPESPKLNMEDESLNTTVNLIRNTMKQSCGKGNVGDIYYDKLDLSVFWIDVVAHISKYRGRRALTIFLNVMSTRSLTPSSGSSSVGCRMRQFFSMWNISSLAMYLSPFRSYTLKQSESAENRDRHWLPGAREGRGEGISKDRKAKLKTCTLFFRPTSPEEKRTVPRSTPPRR
uniref:(Atlantic silverside) hypothetical protein n=1 Tax=Menidia menidia TaxID=238744 RepID=A0A8S4BT52_9TELE|nr:unnamed protein product [Menidia menidia]